MNLLIRQDQMFSSRIRFYQNRVDFTNPVDVTVDVTNLVDLTEVRGKMKSYPTTLPNNN